MPDGGDGADTQNNDDDNDLSKLDTDREAFDDKTIEQIIEEVQQFENLSPEDQHAGHVVVTKVRYYSMWLHYLIADFIMMHMQLVALSKHMFHFSTICADFVSSCQHANIKHLKMKCTIKTCWNSLSECIERAVQLHPGLKHLFSRSKYDKNAKPGLCCYKLTPTEWTILEELNTLLVVCAHFLRFLLTSLPSGF